MIILFDFLVMVKLLFCVCIMLMSAMFLFFAFLIFFFFYFNLFSVKGRKIIGFSTPTKRRTSTKCASPSR